MTCLFSRAVSLNVCQSLDTNAFLKAFQLHIFRYGLPKLIISDCGSSLIAGMNIIKDFISGLETQRFLDAIEYLNDPSGASCLGLED